MIKRSIRLYVKVMRGLVRHAIDLESRLPFGGYVYVVGMFIPYAILVVCVEAAAQAFPSPLMNIAAAVLTFVITMIFAPALWTGAAISTERLWIITGIYRIFGIRDRVVFASAKRFFRIDAPSASTKPNAPPP
jgi:hypothetical protein